jgi:hypothetical protein
MKDEGAPSWFSGGWSVVGGGCWTRSEEVISRCVCGVCGVCGLFSRRFFQLFFKENELSCKFQINVNAILACLN